jgi:hypothetical protein
MQTWEKTIKALEEVTTGSWTRSWYQSRYDTRSPSSKLAMEDAAHEIGTCAFVAIATIASPLHAWFTAMAFHASWLARLQAEVDGICGDDRLPCMNDIPTCSSSVP